MSLTRNLLSSLAIVCLTWLLAATALGQQATQSLQRPKTSTPMTPTQLLATLREAHVQEYGSEPSQSRLAMAWAQVALENDWGRIMWNHNLGNVGPRGTDTWYQHSPKARYRHFDTFVEGGRTYWRVVNWCRAAVRMFDAGAARRAAENLKQCGYFEADLDDYANYMGQLYRTALDRIIPQEKREREEREFLERLAAEYEREHQFTPACACSEWSRDDHSQLPR